ncbi:adenine nucleotide alpha hydrolase family protein [Hymenobacter swuensis]|uniref:hypothetical protein n=1 Tax=Hymenobacter swuensis TaxID=1446467 RepID=UPI0012DE784A|nr:hypothetical protein [Hymenobacter swuensis]
MQGLVQATRLNEALVSVFKHQAIDLVVIGAHGHSATEHFSLRLQHRAAGPLRNERAGGSSPSAGIMQFAQQVPAD